MPKARDPRELEAARETINREHGKMCDKLWAFVTPYLNRADNLLDVHQTFALAVSAWNLPFVPHAERERIVCEADAEEVGLLLEMYMRRVSEFADDPRLVLDYRLTELESGEFVPMVLWVSATPLGAGS